MEGIENDNDWTIRSLNIHGIFFQKLIASHINKSRHAKLISAEYPVEFPSGNRSNRGQESRLDIRARMQSNVNPPTSIDLLIECKKANPDFIDWIFFPRIEGLNQQDDISFLRAYFVQRDKWNVEYDLISRPFSGMITTADDARETRGNYRDAAKSTKTKTSNAAISDAAYQIVLATHAIAEEDATITTKVYERTSIVFPTSIYLPMIVTTANLFLCDFNPLDTAIETGEIPLSKASLRPVDRLFYEYPVPTHLQVTPDEAFLSVNYLSSRERYVRRYILIVNSKKFEETLDWLHNRSEYIVGG